MALKAATRLPGGRTALVDGELLDLSNRAQRGDPTSGWRGDPSMFVCVSGPGQRFVEVFGHDLAGNEYLAVQVDRHDNPGWKHEALVRLIRGDWQTGGVHESIIVANAAVERDAKRRFNDFIEGEGAPKLDWALRKDGLDTKRDHFFPARKAG